MRLCFPFFPLLFRLPLFLALSRVFRFFFFAFEVQYFVWFWAFSLVVFIDMRHTLQRCAFTFSGLLPLGSSSLAVDISEPVSSSDVVVCCTSLSTSDMSLSLLRCLVIMAILSTVSYTAPGTRVILAPDQWSLCEPRGVLATPFQRPVLCF